MLDHAFKFARPVQKSPRTKANWKQNTFSLVVWGPFIIVVTSLKNSNNKGKNEKIPGV